MFIITPISRVSEVTSVIEAGADEIYCGLLTKDQWDNYVNINCLNRRAEISSNLSNYDDLKEVVRMAQLKNIPVSFTLNEFYSQKQVSMALMQLERALDCGIDRVIVSDIGLLYKIKERKYPGLQLHISSCASIFNSETIQFYKMFNPSRIILNRQLTLSEIQHMHQSFPELEMEAFVLNERCYNIDGLCTFLHGRLSPAYNVFIRLALNIMQNRNIKYVPRCILQTLHRYVVKNSLSCCFPYLAQFAVTESDAEVDTPKEKIFLNQANLFLRACAICAIYEFYKMGVKFLKISGRSLLTDKIRDIRLVKEATEILQKEPAKSNFRKKVKDLIWYKYRRICSPEYCYYYDDI